MTTRAPAWRRWVEPVAEAEGARRREAVLFTVLAAFIALSVLTQLIQLARFAVEGDPIRLAFWGVNVAVLCAFVALLMAARAGHARRSAIVLCALIGALAAYILLADGADKPMWPLLAALAAVLAAVLLDVRTGRLLVGTIATTLLVVVALQEAGTLDPLHPSEAARTTNFGGALGVVLVIGFIGLVCAVYARETLNSVDQALTGGSERSPLRRLRTRELSLREVEVVRLVAAGLSNDAIARRLFLSPRTVQSHVANAMRKTACANRTELGVLAVREGLVPLDPEGDEPLPPATG